MHDIILQNPGLRKISFIAHSIGGLVARYAIGKLYKPSERTSDGCEKDLLGTISGLMPMNFITLATPHLGSQGNKQVFFLWN